MKWYFSALAMIIAGASMAQPAFSPVKKLPVDTAVEREATNWPDIYKYSISPNGKYVQYIVENEPEGSSTLVLQAVDKDWKKTITGVENCDISKDDDWVVFKKKDSLCLVRLGTEKMITVPRVKNCELTGKKGTYAIVYLSDEKELVWRELDNNKERRWAGCTNFWMDAKKEKLLLQSERNGPDAGQNYALKWVDLKSEKEHTICNDVYMPIVNIGWNITGTAVVFTTFEPKRKDSVYSVHCYEVDDGEDRVVGRSDRLPNDFHFDNVGEQLAFWLSDTIWYYKRGAVNAIPLVTPQSIRLDGSIHLKDADFTVDGRKLRFRVEIWEKKQAPVNNVNVDIWHYKDQPLQSVQSALLRNSYMAVMNIERKKIIHVTEPGERICNFISMRRFALVEKVPSSNEWCWQVNDQSKFYLVSLETGYRRQIAIESRYNGPLYMISPHEDYLIYYDPSREGYFSYEISSGRVLNLAAEVSVSWQKESLYLWNNHPNPFWGRGPCPRGFAGWVDDDSLFLVYDSHDIWRLDPSGGRIPVNLTGGEGLRNNIIFTLDPEDNGKVLSSQKEWILRAFNPSTKFAGFYRKKMGINSVQKLAMEACFYGLFRKAKKSSVWIGSTRSPSEEVKILVVKDFMSMKPIKICNPQDADQWYTSELVSWQLPNGEVCQGALYKSADMDTSQKYPVLFNYYQLRSDEVYDFKRPGVVGSCNIDVPYWVSRGYLVFMPDIHYRNNDYPGQCALESILSAARFLGRRSYVDTMHMGLAGHSWGGFETNYIVTHSRLFAAAAEGAGPSDFIADYNSLSGIDGTIGVSKQPLYEVGQSRMGGTLWEKPDLYIENSPVIHANQVSTPLLMLHNKQDEAVSWLQGVELFTALRRLGKKVWMLQYDGEGHSLLKPENKLDYTTRLTQFFDHYLKGAPAPKWMVDGIPRYMKGVDSGLELDTTGREP